MKKMFWAPDGEAASRAKQSQFSQRADTFSGVDVLDERVKPFSGTVLAVEDFGEKAPVGKRWRISIEAAD